MPVKGVVEHPASICKHGEAKPREEALNLVACFFTRSTAENRFVRMRTVTIHGQRVLQLLDVGQVARGLSAEATARSL